MQNLQGKTAVIFNAADDTMGFGSATELFARGATIITVDATEDMRSVTKNSLRAAGVESANLCASLTTADGMEYIASQLSERTSRVDILVNCHQYAYPVSIEESSISEWDNAYQHNILGPILSAKMVLPFMKDNGGSIITFGSIDGTLGNPSIPSYSVTKGSLTALSHVMSEEFAKYGIRMNVIARAAAANGEPMPYLKSTLMPFTPLARFATPQDLGNAVSFLASDESAYITGTVLTIDGGRSAITPGTYITK